MNRTKATIRIAARMPGCYRALRGQVMLEPLSRSLGVKEVTCPGCTGSGWLSKRTLRHCPVCVAVGTVPACVAAYFQRQMRRFMNGTRLRRRPEAEPYIVAPTASRWGRTGCVLYKVAAEAMPAALR